MNGGEVGVGLTIIIVAVSEQHVLSGASESIFERDVLAEQGLQHRGFVQGLRCFYGDIGKSKKTCIG